MGPVSFTSILPKKCNSLKYITFYSISHTHTLWITLFQNILLFQRNIHKILSHWYKVCKHDSFQILLSIFFYVVAKVGLLYSKYNSNYVPELQPGSDQEIKEVLQTILRFSYLKEYKLITLGTKFKNLLWSRMRNYEVFTIHNKLHWLRMMT